MKRSRLSLLLSLSLLACSSSGGGSGSAKLTLLLKDAPAPAVTSAVVTIDQIELVGDGAPVPLLAAPVTTVNLLTLAANLSTLVDGATVPAGTYNQLRFTISAGTLEVGGTVYSTADGTLDLPSGVVRVILPDGHLVIGADDETWVVDFDVSQSFGHKAGASGKWEMHPVIKGTQLQQTGGIDVTLALAPEVTFQGTLTLADFSAVLAPAGGGDATTLPLTDLGLGVFGASFRTLAPGDYQVSFTPTFPTDPVTPMTLTVLPGQVTSQAFLITSTADQTPL